MGKSKTSRKNASSTSSRKPKSSKKKKKPVRNVDNLGSDNEVDAFSSEREKVMLQHYSQHEEVEASDSDEVQPVMDLDSDLDDSDEDVFAAEERERYEAERKRDIESEKNLSKAWRRGELYGADTAEYELMGEDEQQDAEDEEKEALRLQKEQREAFDETDFALPSAPAQSKKKKKKKSKKSRKEGVAAAATALLAVNAELDGVTLNLGKDTAAVRVQKDTATLTTEQQLDIVLTDAPEVFALVEEMEAKISEIKNSLQPVLAQVQGRELDTSNGISFLQVKLQVMLSYLTNITFLLMLRAEGKSIKNHPVVGQLARLRVVMEKIKPVDKRLKYQVDKLLRLGANDEANQEVQAEETANALSFRPDPSALEASATQVEGSAADHVYKIPKTSAISFDDSDKLSKQAKRAERLKKRAKQSKLVKELRQDLYTDAPERVEVFGDSFRHGDEEEKEIKSYEEDNFLRIVESKKEQKRRRAKTRIGAFDEFDDFGDLAMLNRHSRATDSLPSKATLTQQRQSSRRTPELLNDSDLKAGLDTYLATAQASSTRRAKRKAAHPLPESKLDPEDWNDSKLGEARAIGNEIMNNRGLTRYRPKDKKNPRKRYRINYEKALVKRRATIKEFNGQQPTYGGEATGIKSTLIRSQKLN